MAILTVIIYTTVLLTAVLYSGGLTLNAIFGVDLRLAVWLVGIVAGFYTTWGGLKAVAWADLFLGLALLVGGLIIFGLGLDACGGWDGLRVGERRQAAHGVAGGSPESALDRGGFRDVDRDCLLLRTEPVHRAAEPGGPIAARRPARRHLRRGALVVGAVCHRDAGHHGRATLRRRSWPGRTRRFRP